MVRELKQGRELPYLTLGGYLPIGSLKFFTILHMSMEDHKSVMSIDLEVKNKF